MLSWKIVAIIALVLSISLLSVYSVLADGPGTDTPEQEVPPHDEPIDPSVTLETPDTVPYPDSALTAAALGVSTAEAIRELTAQDAFDDYVDKVIEQFPGQTSGIWMDSPDDSSVNTRGNIRFKGEVPAGITIMENVRLIGGGGLTLDDHYRRADEVEEALWNYTAQLGYEYLSGYEPDVDKIVIMMQIPEADSASVPSIADFLAAFNQHLGSVSELRGTAAGTLLTADDIQLDITIKDGPMISFQHSRGGNWLLRDSTRACTSGWSVSGPNGNGIVTAAHCIIEGEEDEEDEELNKFEERGRTPYNMTYRDKVHGRGGDAAYYTTSHVELAEFYASDTSKRPVRYKKPTNSMVGNRICFYGRHSNDRVCGIEVTGVNKKGRVDGKRIGNLAMTDSDPGSEHGDSGGPWFSGYTAYGIHVGASGGIAVFMPIEEVEDALDVTLLLD